MDPAAPLLSPADWQARLETALDAPVEVRYMRARTNVVRAHVDERGVWVVDLNAMFADAPGGVQEALGAWLRSGRRARRACAELDGWIEERLARLCREQPRTLRVRTRGQHHDLEPILAGLLESEFAAAFPAPAGPPQITWGRAGRSRSRWALRLGSYDYAARVVRVHPVLDQADVPGWFVRYVLFHELLHAILDEPPNGGRRVLHGPEFRARERAYRDYERARQWETRHIDALIRSARAGRALRASTGLASSGRERVRAGARWVQGLLFGS